MHYSLLMYCRMTFLLYTNDILFTSGTAEIVYSIAFVLTVPLCLRIMCTFIVFLHSALFTWYIDVCFTSLAASIDNKKAVLPQGNRAMPQLFFSV